MDKTRAVIASGDDDDSTSMNERTQVLSGLRHRNGRNIAGFSSGTTRHCLRLRYGYLTFNEMKLR